MWKKNRVRRQRRWGTAGLVWEAVPEIRTTLPSERDVAASVDDVCIGLGTDGFEGLLLSALLAKTVRSN